MSEVSPGSCRAGAAVTARHQRSEFGKGDGDPVVEVWWEDATGHCAWLTEKAELPIRNVTDFLPVDHGQCGEIRVFFGLSINDGEVNLCSVEEDQGVTCFELTCRVDGFDIELEDA